MESANGAIAIKFLFRYCTHIPFAPGSVAVFPPSLAPSRSGQCRFVAYRRDACSVYVCCSGSISSPVMQFFLRKRKTSTSVAMASRPVAIGNESKNCIHEAAIQLAMIQLSTCLHPGNKKKRISDVKCAEFSDDIEKRRKIFEASSRCITADIENCFSLLFRRDGCR